MNAQTNNFLDSLRKGAPASPDPAPGPTVHAAGALAALPALPPGWQYVAGPGGPVPVAPPAPVVAINPPESALPPAPPVGVAAPTPAAEPAKRGRKPKADGAPLTVDLDALGVPRAELAAFLRAWADKVEAAT